jgi:hypothetical protein
VTEFRAGRAWRRRIDRDLDGRFDVEREYGEDRSVEERRLPAGPERAP